jgi:hypothetical protein
MTIPSLILPSDNPPEHLVQSIASWEAVLWIGPGFDPDPQQVALLCRLMEFPWRLGRLW